MPDLDATVGGAAANAFASIDDADAYLDARLNASAWTDDADDDTKARALIDATRDLSAIEHLYQGYRTTSTQALPFPRTLVINTKAPLLATIGLTGYPEYADDILPPDLVSATIELALEYVKSGDSELSATTGSSTVIEKTIGPITTKWARPIEETISITTGLARFPRVLALIMPLFSDAVGHSVVRS